MNNIAVRFRLSMSPDRRKHPTEDTLCPRPRNMLAEETFRLSPDRRKTPTEDTLRTILDTPQKHQAEEKLRPHMSPDRRKHPTEDTPHNS